MENRAQIIANLSAEVAEYNQRIKRAYELRLSHVARRYESEREERAKLLRAYQTNDVEAIAKHETAMDAIGEFMRTAMCDHTPETLRKANEKLNQAYGEQEGGCV